MNRAKEKRRLLDVTAMVVANLCVSYIMDSKNIQAEEVMKQLEVEEEAALEREPNKQVPNSGLFSRNIGYFNQGIIYI